MKLKPELGALMASNQETDQVYSSLFYSSKAHKGRDKSYTYDLRFTSCLVQGFEDSIRISLPRVKLHFV